MNALSVVIFLFTVAHVLGADKIGKHYDLSKVVSLIAVEERYSDSGKTQYFEPLKTKFAEAPEVSKLCKAIEGSSSLEAGQGPFVGHLCRFFMLDKNQKIVGMVSILNYNCRCDINEAHRDSKGRIVADYEKKSFGFVSRNVAQAFYDRLRRDDPAYMKKLDATYAEIGKTVEGLLFGNQKGEQPAAGQPATRAEPK